MPIHEKCTTRLLRTKAYQSLGVFLSGSDYEDFNQSTIESAEKVLQEEIKKNRKRKAIERPDAILENDENQPSNLIEESQKADDFELCIEYYKPDEYVMDGQTFVDEDFELYETTNESSTITSENSAAEVSLPSTSVAEEHVIDPFVFEPKNSKRHSSPARVDSKIPSKRSLPISIKSSTSYEFTGKDSTVVKDTLLDESSASSMADKEEFSFIVKSDPLEQLLLVCNQAEVEPFEDLVSESVKTIKIGEGCYGEVFKTQIGDQDVALKIVPFTLTDEIREINGDYMKSASAILSEAVISKYLSSLSEKSDNSTKGFANVVKMRIVKGKYPNVLLDAWLKYKSKNKESINQSPLEYDSESQHFFVIALKFGGQDLEKFKPKNEKEAVSILIQVISSLRVAEETLKFEHRDLHVGNVLVKRALAGDTVSTRIHGIKQTIDANGVKATIIDFTNSRIKKGDMTIFLDLSTDPELFEGPSDEYQFEIYRMMKEANGNNWSKFNPKTNNLWVHYLSRKLLSINGIRFKRRKELLGIFDQVLYCEDLNEFTELEDVKKLTSPYIKHVSN